MTRANELRTIEHKKLYNTERENSHMQRESNMKMN